MTNQESTVDTVGVVPAVPLDVAGMTSAERARLPLSLDVIKAAAEQHGVCIRPVVREVVDLDTGEVRIVAVRCNATQATKCPACADRNRKSRMAQCREGWHLDSEPVAEREAPSADQVALVTYRSDLTTEYRKAQAEGALDQVDDLREAIREADADLRREGVRGNLPAVERPARKPLARSTRRRQDAPNLPRRKVDKRTVGREFAGKYRPSTFITLTLDTYGKVREDGTPVDPDGYDYRRAARDAVVAEPAQGGRLRRAVLRHGRAAEADHPARALRRPGLDPAQGRPGRHGSHLPPGVVAQPRRDQVQR